MKARPMSHQIEATETPISDQCALVSQGIGPMPTKPR